MLEEESDQAVRYYQRIVRDYPNSEYVAESKKQLELIGATNSGSEPGSEGRSSAGTSVVLPKRQESVLRYLPMTIDKNGVLMTKDFDREKFELIDQIIENQGDILVNQIPNAFTTVISQRQAAPQTAPQTAPVAKPQQNPQQ
jgi:hypothetical protein